MAFEEAVAIYQRTLGALPHASCDERRRCELLLALGEAKEWANDLAGSRAAAEQAAAIARRLGATDMLARAALGVGAIKARKSTATSRWEGGAPDLLQEALQAISPARLPCGPACRAASLYIASWDRDPRHSSSPPRRLARLAFPAIAKLSRWR